jgi:hypothetical protein
MNRPVTGPCWVYFGNKKGRTKMAVEQKPYPHPHVTPPPLGSIDWAALMR